MKKNKLKKSLKLGVFLFGISIFVINCQKDNIIDQEEAIIKQPPKLKATIQRGGKLLNANAILKNKINSFTKKKNNNTFSRTIYSSGYGFSIDTTYIQKIETDSYKSFTFRVERDAANPILENYVITYFNDGTYKQFLIEYPEYETEYSISNATGRVINDDALLYSMDSGNNCFNVPEYTQPICISYSPCGGDTGNGEHEYGDSCDATGNDRATGVCTQGGWVGSEPCTSSSGGSNPSSNDSNTSTTGGSTNTTAPNNNEPEIVVVPLGTKKECKKINTFLNAPENATFKQKLLDLANPTNYAENLDVEFEKSVTAHENETALQERQGTIATASVDITYLKTHLNITKAWVHLHPNDTEGTYSVFSFEDLIGISKILEADKLDTGTFVAFLITKKGDSLTYYALTINNKSKFKNFFRHHNDNDFDFFTATQEEKNKRKNAWDKLRKLRDKYYDDDIPQISSSNVNREQMLRAFLGFMDEANMGTTLFETDASFSTFNKLTLGTSEVKRKLCN